MIGTLPHVFGSCEGHSELTEEIRCDSLRDRYKGKFVGCLLNVPATCQCISGTDLLRQFYVLPH